MEELLDFIGRALAFGYLFLSLALAAYAGSGAVFSSLDGQATIGITLP